METIQLAVISAMINSTDNQLNIDKLEEEFQKSNLNGNISGTEKWIYEGTKNKYIIEKNGKVYVKKTFIIYGNEKSILPEGYQQLEYIESTGTQYINTNIATQNSLWVKFDLQPTKLNGSQSFCTANDWSINGYAGRNYVRFVHNVNAIEIGFRGQYPSISISNQFNTRNIYEIKIVSSDSYFKLNSDSIWSNKASISNLNKPIKILLLTGIATNYNLNDFMHCKLYSATVFSENGNTSWNGIASLDSNGIACMYDTITQTPFYSQGTEEFLSGSKVYNCVGNKNDEDNYEIPITLETTDGNREIKITLDESLKKLNDKTDYLDLANKKVTRYIKQDSTTGDLSLLDNAIQENITIIDSATNEEFTNIGFNNIISIKVNTDVEPSKIE